MRYNERRQYSIISTATVATATIASEKALNVGTRVQCGCNVGCLEEVQRSDALYTKTCLVTKWRKMRWNSSEQSIVTLVAEHPNRAIRFKSSLSLVKSIRRLQVPVEIMEASHEMTIDL